MSVTAKVKIQSKEEFASGAAKLNFGTDYADGRNKAWAEATPQLNLSMLVNAETAELFSPGQPFTLTFERDE